MACGDITDVKIEDQFLVINVEEGMLGEILREGKKQLETALRWQGLDLKIKINLKKPNSLPQQEDINKLKKILGEKLKIIGG